MTVFPTFSAADQDRACVTLGTLLSAILDDGVPARLAFLALTDEELADVVRIAAILSQLDDAEEILGGPGLPTKAELDEAVKFGIEEGERRGLVGEIHFAILSQDGTASVIERTGTTRRPDC